VQFEGESAEGEDGGAVPCFVSGERWTWRGKSCDVQSAAQKPPDLPEAEAKRSGVVSTRWIVDGSTPGRSLR